MGVLGGRTPICSAAVPNLSREALAWKCGRYGGEQKYVVCQKLVLTLGGDLREVSEDW